MARVWCSALSEVGHSGGGDFHPSLMGMEVCPRLVKATTSHRPLGGSVVHNRCAECVREEEGAGQGCGSLETLGSDSGFAVCH